MLLKIFKGNQTAVRALLMTAVTSVEADCSRIVVALSAHDAVALAEAAHHLKGTAATLGARALIEASKAVQALAQQGFALPLESLVRDVERESAEFVSAIDRYLL